MPWLSHMKAEMPLETKRMPPPMRAPQWFSLQSGRQSILRTAEEAAVPSNAAAAPERELSTRDVPAGPDPRAQCLFSPSDEEIPPPFPTLREQRALIAARRRGVSVRSDGNYRRLWVLLRCVVGSVSFATAAVQRLFSGTAATLTERLAGCE